MTSLLAFTAPWLLAALVVLPALWWLLRVTPPSPRLVRFPAVRLLRELRAPEETPARTPLWLVLLRMLLVALVIVALAGPVWNPRAGLPGSGPLLLVVDDGWASAQDWPARRDAMQTQIALAERMGRDVVLLPTARRDAAEPLALRPMPAREAREIAETLEPKPWPNDHLAARAALDGLGVDAAQAVWLSDGLDGPGAREFADRLIRFGSLDVLVPDAAPVLLIPPSSRGEALEVTARRPAGGPALALGLTAGAGDGRVIAQETLRFDAGADSATVSIVLPTELRNALTRLHVEGLPTAGATVLLDDATRRRIVGIVRAGSEAEAQPLLNPTHYIERALEPHAGLRRGTLSELLERTDLSVIVLPDSSLSEAERAELERWVEQGGVLLRFAGPLLAANPDGLAPVRLRQGDRALGGALSWADPAVLAPFPAGSPFAGLAVPDDVTVSRQVLADPDPELNRKSWARLEDGTPIVTGDRRGEGTVVLVHTSADASWSNLALSGLFVDMLQRVTALSAGAQAVPVEGTLEPLELLDGYGRLVAPPPEALPLRAESFTTVELGPSHPPGLYGQGDARRALNLADRVPPLQILGDLPSGATRSPYEGRGELPLAPWLLAAALALASVDTLVGLALRGHLLRRRVRHAAATAVTLALLAVALPVPQPALAQVATDDATAAFASGKTLLAYVRTGDPEIDEVSKAGLDGLAQTLFYRTALEEVASAEVDVETDELAFYPLLYWPVTAATPELSADAVERLNAYMRNGGLILFDTREGDVGGDAAARLRDLAQGLDIPPLEPVPEEHVLTKAFYLLDEFPGRYADGTVWVEASSTGANDGVSPVILASNDYAAAWAVDEAGFSLFPVIPDGEPQREMAFRFGVNLVMYALTGNYKADQVHVPAILERLGQ